MKKKDKNGKIPFNVFSKKGLMGLAIAGVMAFTPFMAGCSGTPGDKGDKGDTGATGKSAYELAVEAGFEGTLQEWLDSLKGATGSIGETGSEGAQGLPGKDGSVWLTGEGLLLHKEKLVISI